MARISRNGNNQAPLQNEQGKQIFKTAVYARLSVEDNGAHHGESLENQIYMLKNYISKKPYLTLCSTYTDNGMTGTDFNRPGFESMMEAVKTGKVNCIVVKDLSRFGRNYIETGNYIENIFPYLGVRFISVNDQFDNMTADNGNIALMVSLKNLIHDIYARDISHKICTTFDVQKKNGEFLGRFAPHGYSKSAANRHALEINEETAPVIREIFMWRLHGFGASAIAHKLNDLGLPSPGRYLWQKGLIKDKRGETALWHGGSVQSILLDPVYTGCTVERKTDSSYYKGGTIRIIPREKWNLIEGTHKPIIDRDTFELVHRLIDESKKARAGKTKTDFEEKESSLSGLIVCGNCNRHMSRSRGYFRAKDNKIIHRFYCAQRYISSGSCHTKGISEDDLLNAIRKSVQVLVKTVVNPINLPAGFAASSQYDSRILRIKHEVQNADQALKQKRRYLNSLYEDYVGKILAESEYRFSRNKYEKEVTLLKLRLSELMLEKEQIVEQTASENYSSSISAVFEKETRLAHDLCVKLIKNITVYDDKSIEIHFRYADVFQKVISVQEG